MDTRQNVTFAVGGGAKVNFNAPSVTSLAAVTVNANAVPAIDTSQVDSRTVVTSEQLARLPLQRTAEAIAQLAPGVNAGTSAYAALTGPEGQTLNSFGGSSIAENAYYINGFNTTDPLHNFGGLSLPYGAVDQEQVLTGGYSARYGRSDGGVINQVGKRGTNEWHFGFQELWRPDFGNASPGNQYYPTGPQYLSNANGGTQGMPYRYRNDNTAWSHVEDAYLGGPLIRDKLFLFAAVEADHVVTGQNVGSVETKQATTYSYNNPKWYAKLDWNINDNNILELTGASNKSSYQGNIYAYNYPTDGSIKGSYGAFKGPDTHTKNGADLWSAKYTGYLTDNLTVDALFGKMHQTAYSQASSSDQPYISGAQFQDPAFTGGQPIVGPQTISTVNNPNANDKTRNLRLDIDYKIGDHDITAGIDNMDTQSLNIGTIRSGPGYIWIYGQGDPSLPISTLAGQEVGAPGGQGYYADKDIYTTGAPSVRVKQRAQFIEDRWHVTDNLLLSIGVRNDQFTNYNPDNQAFLRLTKPNWSPRLGASWDVFGDASLKVYANAGRYYLDEPANVAIRGASGSVYTDQYFTYSGIDPTTGQPTGLTQIPQGHYPGVSANNEFGTPPDARQVTSKNAQAEYQDEFIVGADKAFDMLGSRWTAGAKGTYRVLRNMLDDVCETDVFINEGVAQGFDPDAAEGQGCYIMNPGRNSSFNVPLVYGSTTSGYGTMNIPWSAFDMPQLLRKYLALDLYLEHQFNDKWYGRIDYTLSHSFGNSEGSVRSDIGQADVAQTEDWDNSGVMTYANGDQANDRRHQIKLRGYWQPTPEWLLAGTAQILSGTPRTCLGYFGPTQTDPFGYRAAYHFCGPEGTPAPGGATGRTPWQEILSVNAEYRPAFADHKLAFSVVVYNLLNQQRVTQYYSTSESGPGKLSKDFWVPISQQQPRYVQLGVSYDF